MVKRRKKYTKVFKAEVVKLVLDGGQSTADVARKQGLQPSTIYSWVSQARVDGGNGPPGALTTEEREDYRRLQREVREQRRERDFSKQAATYFAKAKK